MVIAYVVKDGKKVDAEGIPNSIGALLIVVNEYFVETIIEEYVFVLKYKNDEYLIDQHSDLKKFYRGIHIEAKVEFHQIKKVDQKSSYQILNATLTQSKKVVETTKPKVNNSANWLNKVNNRVTDLGNDKKTMKKLEEKFNIVMLDKEMSEAQKQKNANKDYVPFDFSLTAFGADWQNNDGEKRLMEWIGNKCFCCKKKDTKKSNKKVKTTESCEGEDQYEESDEDQEDVNAQEMFKPLKVQEPRKPKKAETKIEEKPIIEEKKDSKANLPDDIRKILEENQRLKEENERLKGSKNDDSLFAVPNKDESIGEPKKMK